MVAVVDKSTTNLDPPKDTKDPESAQPIRVNTVTIHRQRIQWLGWHADRPDLRDKRMATVSQQTAPSKGALPNSTEWLPPIRDQQNQGSCTGFATRSAVQYKRNANGETKLELSPRFIYFNGRLIEATTDQDAGCEIRDVIKGVAKLGVSTEKLCPYSDRVYRQRPSSAAYREGMTDQVTQYARVPQINGEHDRNAIKHSILIGDPVVFGFTVYESFMSDTMADEGIMREPTGGVDGGHAVWMVAYDDNKDFGWTKGGVKCGNSWGTDWGVAGANGQRGFFWAPWRLIADTDWCDDLWSISVVKK